MRIKFVIPGLFFKYMDSHPIFRVICYLISPTMGMAPGCAVCLTSIQFWPGGHRTVIVYGFHDTFVIGWSKYSLGTPRVAHATISTGFQEPL